jgi:hypothetical protein
MLEMIRLESDGQLLCEIQPKLGGCISGLWLDDVPVLLSSLSRLVVFSHGSRDSVAIEPVSHVSNAINLVAAGADAAQLGLCTLQPGETLTANMSIAVERVT